MLNCDYESPHSTLKFIIWMPEVHSSIVFLLTCISSYFFIWLPAYGWPTALASFTIGITFTLHLARGRRSVYVYSLLEALYQLQQQYQQSPEAMTAAYQHSTGMTSSNQFPTSTQQSFALTSHPAVCPPLYAQYAAIVTGASSGIGQATAQLLARLGFTVIFAVRNCEKAKTSINEICSTMHWGELHPNRQLFHILPLDLSDLTTIPKFVQSFRALNIPQLAMIINNAGAMLSHQKLISQGISPVEIVTQKNIQTGAQEITVVPFNKPQDLSIQQPSSSQPQQQEDSDNYQQNSTSQRPLLLSSQTSSHIPSPSVTTSNSTITTRQIIDAVDNSFLTNHLGHFLLVLLLLDDIIRSNTRIISLSSAIHVSVSPKQVSAIDCTMYDPQTWQAPNAYANTKICNIWFTRGLQRRLDTIMVQYSPTSRRPHSASLSRNSGAGDFSNNGLLRPSSCDDSSINDPIHSITSPAAFAVHPGTVWSPFHMPFYRESYGGLLMWFPIMMMPLAYCVMKSPNDAALTAVHCGIGRHAVFSKLPDLSQVISSSTSTTAVPSTSSATSAIAGGLPPPISSMQQSISSSAAAASAAASAAAAAAASSGASVPPNTLTMIRYNPFIGPQPGQLHADSRVCAMSPYAADETQTDLLWSLSVLLCRQFLSSSTVSYPEMLQ